MRIRKKWNERYSELNLDPLMDVLTCTVGIMLFIIIFAVIEARGISFKFFTPIQASSAPAAKKRNLLICQYGMIKNLHIDMPYDSLPTNIEFTYDNIPKIINEANKLALKDEFFTFEFKMREERSWSWERRREVGIRYLDVVIHENDINEGDDVTSFENEESFIRNFIVNLNPDKNWIAFLLRDEPSIEVFRKARQLAIEKNIVNGWDPISLDFPFTIYAKDHNQTSNTKFEGKRDLATPQGIK
jgi:hypothetical protein